MSRPAETNGIPVEYAAYLTSAAWFVTLVLVLARATLSEITREPPPVLGGEAAPLAFGPAAATWLDLLACLPAMLVLLRRAVDPTYPLRLTWMMLPMGLLAGLVAASTLWAEDAFASVNAASRWVAAMALLWAATQLVRTWRRLRQAAGVAVAVLLMLALHGVIYTIDDVPTIRENFEQNRETILAAQGIEPGTFAAEQYERRVMSGSIQGFTTSPNSYGAMLVFGLTVAAGAGLQRLRDKDPATVAAGLLLPVPVALWLLTSTQSKSAYAAAGIGIALAGLAWWLGGRTARRPRLAFAGGATLVLLGAAAVVGYGLTQGTLPIDSLRFRWNYWIGSMGVLAERPVLGVGWADFGEHYLAHRVPNSAEEIRDPHNTLLRFATELGLVGLILAVAWLGRLAWEITRPATPPATQDGGKATGWVVWPALVALGLVVLSGVDFSVNAAFGTFETFKRAALAAAAMIGFALVAVGPDGKLDGRPAFTLALAMAAAVGVFVLQSMLDVMMFEPAALYPWVLVAGALVGLRTPSVAGRKMRTPVALAASGVALAGVAAWAVTLGLPMTLAESARHRGDALLREGRFAAAEAAYREADNASPATNSDYARRQARAHLYGVGDPRGLDDDGLARSRRLLTAVAERRPGQVGPRMAVAQFEETLPPERRDVRRLERAYAESVAIDPNNVPLRLGYGDLLRGIGEPAAARAQYEAALAVNDAYDPAEPERLGEQELAEVTRKLRGL